MPDLDERSFTLEPSLVAMLRAAVERGGAQEALVEVGGERLSYDDVWARARRVAGGLGVAPGDRVALVLPNGVDWCLAFLGALLAGAVPVPVNPRLTPAEVEHVVRDSGAAVVLRGSLPDGEPLVVDDRGHADLAALFYTSGTTGLPKGAMLTHGSVLAALEACQRALLWPDQGIRTLVPLPLFHVMGALNQLLPTLRQVGTAVIMPGFDVQVWVETMGAERIDVVSAVPAIYWQALRLPAFETTDTSSVGWVVYGGAATPPEQVLRLREAFPGARLFSGYGLTETSGGITGIPHEHAVERSDTVGLPLPGVELRVRDHELLVRSPQVMTGYWGHPTTDALEDGWLATGDAAEISDDGFVRIVDRLKDVIIRGGENVYCLEVENLLAGHPQVAEVALLAVPDERLGERVGAVIVPTADLDVDALKAWARQHLAAYKVPEVVHLRAAPLPRGATGKVLKGVLRSETVWDARAEGGASASGP